MDNTSEALAYSEIFASPGAQNKPTLFKSVQADRSRTQTDLRALINNVLMSNSQIISSHSQQDSHYANQGSSETFGNHLQEDLSAPISKYRKRVVHLKTSSVGKDPIKSNQRSLREKRLDDAQAYRSFHSRESSNSFEKSSHFSKQSLGNSMNGKSQIIKLQNNPENVSKKKNGNTSIFVHMPTLTNQENGSAAYSIDYLSKDNDSTRQGRKNSSSLAVSYSCEKLLKIRDDSKEKEGWRDYYSKAADPTFTSKFDSYSKQRLSSASLEGRDKFQGGSETIYRKIKLPYAEFLKKNFDESIIERLDTFGAFAFTSVEREDNKEIPNFFSESKQTKESKGSMGIVDLWSHKLVSELAQRAGFSQEKKIIEKLAFYKAREKKMENGKKPEFVILHRKNENIYKDLLARKELAKFQKKHENIGLMSSMQRHMPLQGKSFLKPREKSNDTPNSRSNLNNIKGGFANIINDLNDFAEQNQDDYMKLLEYSTSEKKIPKKKIKNLKKFVERRGKV